MQSSSPQSLPWGAPLSSTAHPIPDQITRQLMPSPSNSNLPFNDVSAIVESESSAYASKSNSSIDISSEDGSRSLMTMGTMSNSKEVWDNLERVASENAVVMFSLSSCCVCHVVKRLFSSLGVAPVVYELDQEAVGPEILIALQKLAGSAQALPSIFIGKKYIGGLEELIAAHIGGVLVPQLKQAGALWL